MNADRISTLVVFLCALGFVFVILPHGAETMDYGTLNPATMPRVLGYIIAALAAVQMFFPKTIGSNLPEPGQALRAGFMFMLTIIGSYLINVVGFLVVSIFLATTGTLFMGQRRIAWVAASGVGLPLVIWAIVTLVLDRNLP